MGVFIGRMNDDVNTYIVYSKGETQGAEQDRIIYISKLFKEDDSLKISEITDDEEWANVQQQQKKIANAK